MTPQDLAAIAYAELRVTVSDPAPTKMLAARITAAIEPDPTPALGWRVMQTAAAEACNKRGAQEQREYGLDRSAQNCFRCRDDVRAIPGPTDAQLLAEAVKLPEVQELVKASKWVGFAAQTSGGTAGRDLALIAAIDVLAAALAKIGGAA